MTLLYGGRSLRPEYTALKNGAQIFIGTPGRTLDHLRQGTLDLRSVRFLVLDEADEMLDRGFARDVEAILSRSAFRPADGASFRHHAGVGGEDRQEIPAQTPSR